MLGLGWASDAGATAMKELEELRRNGEAAGIGGGHTGNGER